MNILPGTTISLEAAGGARLPVRLLGVVSGSYLALRDVPARHGNMDFTLNYGEKVVLRYLHEGTVTGFRSYVLNMVKEPERLLFVAYPSEVQHYALRRADRIKCTLPSQLFVRGAQYRAVIADLSETGCQCIIRRHADQGLEDGHELMGEAVELDAPGLDATQIQLDGTIRRVSADPQALRVGIQFNTPQTALFQEILDALRPLIEE
jgi:c-di-GMP-binding flagellar brake protein YcgR